MKNSNFQTKIAEFKKMCTFAVMKINDFMRCFEHNTLILTPSRNQPSDSVGKSILFCRSLPLQRDSMPCCGIPFLSPLQTIIH